jgi:DNA-binding CsgD family transcriptional regulator/phosphotransferase system IIB component
LTDIVSKISKLLNIPEQYIRIIGICIILFILFLLTLKNRKLLYRNELQKTEFEKTRLKLEMKNKELITNALHLASLTEFSNQFSEKVQEIMNKQTDSETKKSLSEILNEVNNVVPQGAWKDFETRFEQVHEGFSKKLFSDYPDLSSAELKICSFLRLNMTTKDIALLTHRSQRTIENQRNSIRKKMNLMTDSNLEGYLIKNY